MKLQKKVLMTIKEDGSISIETFNFIGKSCTEETQFLKDMLGHETVRELKPTYFEKEKVVSQRWLPICG